MRFLKKFAVITTIGLFLVIIMGALVTKTGSGEGCGDSWPLCHGQLTPLGTIESTIEYSHRAVSGIVGVLVTIFAIWAWLAFREKRDVGWLAFFGVFFVFLQAGLGAAAVVWGQSEAVLALHFGFSLISFASVLLLTVRVFQYDRPSDTPKYVLPRSMALYVWGLLAYIYIVVYIGAYVSYTGAGPSCSGWPLCNGEVIPKLVGLTPIAFGHRIAAFLVLLGVLWLVYLAKPYATVRRDIYSGSIIALLFVLLQVLSGAAVVLSGYHLIALMAHATFISLFFGSMSFLAFQVLNNR